jgi:hypothetical protein
MDPGPGDALMRRARIKLAGHPAEASLPPRQPPAPADRSLDAPGPADGANNTTVMAGDPVSGHVPVPRDVEGIDLRPDPLTARTPAELAEALREYRIWAGEPPYRTMAARARQKIAASTMCTALGHPDRLPRLEVVLAIVAGCGGPAEDQQRFATAWRQVRTGRRGRRQDRRAVPPAAAAGRSSSPRTRRSSCSDRHGKAR